MSETNNDPAIDEVMTPTETPHPDRSEHAKTPHRVDDDELAERTEHEQGQVDSAEARERDT
ncbi:MAG TPA: hypothetical protein VGH43_04950 [Jatrophihabitans sp.]|jgi:hypothetical protein